MLWDYLNSDQTPPMMSTPPAESTISTGDNSDATCEDCSEPPPPKRCDIILRQCRANCTDAFEEGPFPGYSGADQFFWNSEVHSGMYESARLRVLRKKMLEEEIKLIVAMAENLQEHTAQLISAIDTVKSESHRRRLRRNYAELIGFIEEKFVYEVRMNQEN